MSGYGREAKKCCKYERKIILNAMTGYPVAVPLVSFRSHVYPIYKSGSMSSEFLKNVSLFRILFEKCVSVPYIVRKTTCTSSLTCCFFFKLLDIVIM